MCIIGFTAYTIIENIVNNATLTCDHNKHNNIIMLFKRCRPGNSTCLTKQPTKKTMLHCQIEYNNGTKHLKGSGNKDFTSQNVLFRNAQLRVTNETYGCKNSSQNFAPAKRPSVFNDQCTMTSKMYEQSFSFAHNM